MLDQIWNPDPQSPLSIHGSETEMYLIHDAEILMLNLQGISVHGSLPQEGDPEPNEKLLIRSHPDLVSVQAVEKRPRFLPKKEL